MHCIIALFGNCAVGITLKEVVLWFD